MIKISGFNNDYHKLRIAFNEIVRIGTKISSCCLTLNYRETLPKYFKFNLN